MLGIGAMLATPDELVGPGAGLIPKGSTNMNARKAANRMSPETMFPAGQRTGSPSVPGTLHQTTATISPKGIGQNVHVRAVAGSTMNIRDIIGNTGGGNPSINVNLQDQRSSLNPHIIANKMV